MIPFLGALCAVYRSHISTEYWIVGAGLGPISPKLQLDRVQALVAWTCDPLVLISDYVYEIVSLPVLHATTRHLTCIRVFHLTYILLRPPIVATSLCCHAMHENKQLKACELYIA